MLTSSSTAPGRSGDPSVTWSAMLLAAHDSDKPAATFRNITISGRELLDRASGLAAWLRECDLPAGAPVPALLASSVDALALVVAGAGSQRPIAPLGVRMTAGELTPAVADSDAPVVVAQPEFSGLAAEIAAGCGARVLTIPEHVRGQHPLTAAPNDTALVLYTSGTTGAPKAVPMPQWQLAARSNIIGHLCEFTPGDLYGIVAPFHHLSGIGNASVALARGAAVTGLPGFSVDAWRELTAAGITHATLVPAMIEMLLTAGAAEYSGLHTLQYGAAPIRPDTLRRTMAALPGVRMVNMFGQTEGSPLTALMPDDHRLALAERPQLLRSVGRAAPWTELRIDTPGTDGAGEVWARGDHMFVVDGAGWLHSGDIGRLDDDGYLFLVGRGSDKIIRGGENIFPAEVESVIETHPQVREAAVVGVPDTRLGQTVAAFIVATDPDAPPNIDELRGAVRSRLSGFKVPTQWHFLSELPRNPSGKVLRRALVSSGEAFS